MRFEELLDRQDRGHLRRLRRARCLGYRSGVSDAGSGATGRWARRGSWTGGSACRRRGGRRRASWCGRGRSTREMYAGFTVKHFHEKLVERHGYRLGYTVTRLALQACGAGEAGAAARGASAQAAAAAVAGDAAAPGGGAPRLAGGPAADRPGGDARRRDERRSARRSWSRRRAPPRASGRWPR